MPSSIVEESLSVGRREIMHKIGAEGEHEVGLRLSKVFGYRNVSIGIEGFSDGTDEYPDISLIVDSNLFYVEVKSIAPFTYSKGKHHSNSVKLNRDSWSKLKERARGKIATIIMVVELRISYGDNDYFIIDFDTLEDFVLKSKGEWIHIPLWYVLMKCKKLEWVETEFIYNPIDTPQISLAL